VYVDPETGEVIEPEPEQEDGEPEEPFEDPEPQAITDEKNAAALDKALTAEDTRHQKALGKAFGEQWPEHVRCALCDGVGFLAPELAQGLNNAQWEELLGVAAMLVTSDYEDDPMYETCPNCKGKTKTKSGAQDAEHYLKMCDVCSGNGFVARTPKFTPLPVPDIQPMNGTQSQPVIPNYGSPAADDLWGRPGGHPHYGIPPAAVTG
jgi:hypothetical protein